MKMTHGQHAVVERVYEDLAEQLDWPRGSGIKRDAGEWHQLIVGGFAEEKGWKPKFLPALNGEGFVMIVRTKQSRLTKRQGSELIEFARSWAIDNGVTLSEPPAPKLESPPLEAYANAA